MSGRSLQIAVVGGVTLARCSVAWPARHPNDEQSFDEIARGRYLTVLPDCAACHTAPGGRPFAGGRQIPTPFGNLTAPNITPDPETGIGS